jgi:hypothetical protein
MRTTFQLFLASLLAVWFGACGRIETGLTDEEAIRFSQDTASRLRANWAHEINSASPCHKARLLHSLYVRVTDSYIRIGYEAAEKWRESERARGVPFPDFEMQALVRRWMRTEEPVLSAYSDNIDYALEQIRLSGYFGEDLLDAFQSLADQYDRVCSLSFNPDGTPEEYEWALEQLAFQTEAVGERVAEVIEAL